MGDLFAELKRRHIYRVGAGYVVVAWAVAQTIDLLSQIFALPAWMTERKIKPVTMMTFTRQLATLLDAGLPLMRGLRLLKEQDLPARPGESVRCTVWRPNSTRLIQKRCARPWTNSSSNLARR